MNRQWSGLGNAQSALFAGVWVFALLFGAGVESCRATSEACPPAQLASINAHYIAAVASACAGTPRKKCDAATRLNAERLKQERDIGCL